MGFNSGFKGLTVVKSARMWKERCIEEDEKHALITSRRSADFENATSGIIIIFNYALQPSRLIVRSGLDVPTFVTRRLHACHHARAPSGGRWNCGREMSGNFT